MTQNFTTSPEVIFDTLTGDSTFMSLVGNYTFKKDSTSIDSISITTPGADLPVLRSQSGLEVIIHDSGNVSNFKYLTDSSESLITWKVFLIVWPPATGSTMMAAAQRMVEIFGKATAIETVATSDGLGSLVQTLVLIPSDSPILI